MAEAGCGEIRTRCLKKENQREHTFSVNNPTINQSNATVTTCSPREETAVKMINQNHCTPGLDKTKKVGLRV